MARLLLDDHFSEKMAERLRLFGHDVQTSHALGLHVLRDDEQLWLECISLDRVMVTFDKDDFPDLYRKFYGAGITHPGLIMLSSKSFAQNDYDGQSRGIDELLTRYPVLDDLMLYAQRSPQ